MAVSISFLHCGDIHLGNNQYNEPVRLEDFAKAFRQVTDYALKNKVDFVLISGDFFHKRAINAGTLEQAVELLKPLKEADIPLIAIEGNHDKAYYKDKNSWLSFLNNQKYLYLLQPSFKDGSIELLPWNNEESKGSIFDLLNVRIYGLGYLGITTATRLSEVQDYIVKDNDKYNIMLLHAGVNRLLGQDLGGVKTEIMEPFKDKIDYVALGHIHTRYDIDDWIYNPGSLECCHLDEFKYGVEKGFYHVTVKDGQKSMKYINSKYRPVCICSIKIEEKIIMEELYSVITEELKNEVKSSGFQIRVILRGKSSFSPLQLDMNDMEENLQKDFEALYVEIVNELNLPQEGSVSSVNGFKREEIEKLVFKSLLEKNTNWQDEQLDKAVDVVSKIKELVLNDSSEEELTEFLVQIGEYLISGEDEVQVPFKTEEGEKE